MFPKKLNRKQYFLRWLVWLLLAGGLAALSFGLIDRIEDYGWLLLLIFLALFALRIACIDIPRTRSIGWSPWLLFLLPLSGGIIQILLFVMPPSDGPNPQVNSA